MEKKQRGRIGFRRWMFLFSVLLFAGASPFLPASELTDQFSEKYQSLIPRANTSVGSDYLFEQISLGSDYTVRALDLLYGQNQAIIHRYDELLEKYDIIIEQNSHIVELLKKMVPETADGEK